MSHLFVPKVQMQLIINSRHYIHTNLLPKVLSVCSALHIPAPSSDTALTLTLYSVPASSPVRIAEVAGGEPERGVALFQEVVPLILYCTWYSVMATSLWGVVQLTFRDDVPFSTVLVTKTPLTLEGAVRDIYIIECSIPL